MLNRKQTICCAVMSTCAMLGLAGTVSAGPVTLYVDDDAAPSGNGLSWDTAYCHVQDALAAVPEGPVGGSPHVAIIRVAQGTYLPDHSDATPTGTGDRSASFFMVDAVRINGGYYGVDPAGLFGPDDRDIEQFETILSGDLAGNDDGTTDTINDNSYHVVTSVSNPSSTIISGVTISGGNAIGTTDYQKTGGGLIVTGSGNELRVQDTTFVNNASSSLGGAVYIVNTLIGDQPRFVGCSFIDNESVDESGGAIYVDLADVQISDCYFEGNSAAVDGGAVWLSSFLANTFDSNTFVGNHTIEYGGAVWSSIGGTLNAVDCLFDGNSSGPRGGAIYVDGGGLAMDNCTLINNVAQTELGAGQGGAIYNSNNPVLIENSVIESNLAARDGGGVFSFSNNSLVIADSNLRNNSAGHEGGAVYSHDDELTIIGTIFAGNSASINGGGVFAQTIDQFIFNSLFAGNEASSDGGGIITVAGDGVIANSIFDRNTATVSGGGAHTQEMIIDNCTFIENRGVTGAGDSIFASGEFSGNETNVRNCVAWVDFDARGVDTSDNIAGGPVRVDYSLVQGWTGELEGVGTISADPMFVDPDGPDDDPLTFEDNDYHLAARSPCIDAGFNNGVPLDGDDLDDDGDTSEFLPIDFDGNPRFADDQATTDTGCGFISIVDMGAFEFQGVPAQPVPADVDGDFMIGATDLAMLLGSWGECEGCCPADINGDFVIDAVDLALLLGNWT